MHTLTSRVNSHSVLNKRQAETSVTFIASVSHPKQVLRQMWEPQRHSCCATFLTVTIFDRNLKFSTLQRKDKPGKSTIKPPQSLRAMERSLIRHFSSSSVLTFRSLSLISGGCLGDGVSRAKRLPSQSVPNFLSFGRLVGRRNGYFRDVYHLRLFFWPQNRFFCFFTVLVNFVAQISTYQSFLWL